MRAGFRSRDWLRGFREDGEPCFLPVTGLFPGAVSTAGPRTWRSPEDRYRQFGTTELTPGCPA